MSIKLYRKTNKTDSSIFEYQKSKSTRRPPGNVPYIVDNLWEWARPEDMPNRRHSVFAGPDPEALDIEGQAYQVELSSDAVVAQIPENDAKWHPDVKRLPKAVLKHLGLGWATLPLEEKAHISPLWGPCLSAQEVERLLDEELLVDLKGELRKLITLWDDAKLVSQNGDCPFSTGEAFFEASSWRLIPT
ncbi:hypothetical protein J2T60_001624 [Natronospira proteinivora]|uniref:Uncharacterized protein n=1 Tax=Natronospira proteinivora TaxID=1807133 RepID=A0ABT1G8I0_9GAMM|nr:hypothetical protein [Natronospira proteinivora]MCP1727624.1 hypothetical protein [Natronospira proteinivora]